MLSLEPLGLKTFCVFIVDVASVGRFPIEKLLLLHIFRAIAIGIAIAKELSELLLLLLVLLRHSLNYCYCY